MPLALTFALPAEALEKLMERYRRGDPKLQAALKELGVPANQIPDEEALSAWENEGGK